MPYRELPYKENEDYKTFIKGKENFSFQKGKKEVSFDPVIEELLTPEVIRSVLRLFKKTTEGQTLLSEDGMLEVENLPIPHAKLSGERHYYRIKIGNKEFFCKKVDTRILHITGGGLNEFRDTQKAAENLSKLFVGLPNIRIIHAVLGFVDKNNSYFISEWNPILLNDVKDYIDNLGKNNDPMSLSRKINIEKRISDIERRLSATHRDALIHNMSYDPEADMVYLFDINKYHQPIR